MSKLFMRKRLIGLGLVGALAIALAVMGTLLWGPSETASANANGPVGLVHVNPDGTDYTGNPYCPDTNWSKGAKEPVVNAWHDCNNVTSQDHVIRTEGFDVTTMLVRDWNLENFSGATSTIIAGWSPTGWTSCGAIAEVVGRPDWDPINDGEMCIVIHSSTPGETRVTFTYVDLVPVLEYTTNPVVKEWDSLVDSVIIKNPLLKGGSFDKVTKVTYTCPICGFSHTKTMYLIDDANNDGKRDTDDEHELDQQSTWQDHGVIVDETRKRIKVPVPIHIVEIVHGEHQVLINNEIITTHQPTEGALVLAEIESDRGCTFFTDDLGSHASGPTILTDLVTDGLGRVEVWVDTICEEQAEIHFHVQYPNLPGSLREGLHEWIGINWTTIELAKQPQIRWIGEEIVLQKRWALPDEWYPNLDPDDPSLYQPICPLATAYPDLWGDFALTIDGPWGWDMATQYYVNWVRKDPSPGAFQGAYIDSDGDGVLDSLDFMGASEARGDIDEECISKLLADSETPGQFDAEAKLIESTWVCEPMWGLLDDDGDTCVDEDPWDGLDNDVGVCATRADCDITDDAGTGPPDGDCNDAGEADLCLNAVDDDGDGVVNDGCPVGGYNSIAEIACDDALDNDPDTEQDDDPEAGGECTNFIDDDHDGYVNDGCGQQGDGAVNDGCPPDGNGEDLIAGACDNVLDDDGDTWVNDGCPVVGAIDEDTIAGACGNATDDDLADNAAGTDEGDIAGACDIDNAVDDDYDGYANDGCPMQGDGLVNDGCPTVGDGFVDEDPENPVRISWDPVARQFVCNYAAMPVNLTPLIPVEAARMAVEEDLILVPDGVARLISDELVNKHPFLVWFIKMYEVKLTNVDGERENHNAGKWAPADPIDDSTDVTEEKLNVSADALVRVRVKGWLELSNPSGRPDTCIDMNGNGNGLEGEDATPPGEAYRDDNCHDGCPDPVDECVPAGHWVLPDDLVDDEDDDADGNLAGADAINTRPNWDVMQELDGPNSDAPDYIGPKSTLDSHDPVGKPVTRPWLGRKTVFPDGKITDADAIMPPLKIRAAIEEDDAGFLKGADKKADVYTGNKNLYYRIYMPADFEIPAFIQDGGYDWSSEDFPPPADDDLDGVPNDEDNCPTVFNPDQSDVDNDDAGDRCDDDADDDTVLNADDNCWLNANPGQEDANTNNIGNVCETGGQLDSDGDTIPDATDNCDTVSNAPAVPGDPQLDQDGDGYGDACDYNKALPYWIRPAVPYEFWTLIQKKEREDENEANPALAKRPYYIEFYTDNRGEGMFFVNGDFNLSYDDCKEDPLSLAPDCSPGDVVGKSTITVIGDTPYTRGKQAAIESNPVIKTWEWGGYKEVKALEVDPTHILIIAELKDRDGFCKYNVKSDPTSKDGVQFSPSLHEVQHEWIEFLLNTGIGSILVPESTGVSPNALLVDDDPNLDPHVHEPLAKTRATGLEDGVIVNARRAMARAEDVRILEHYDKARGVAEGLVDDEACQAWVLIQHPINEMPDVSVIFNDPEGVITRHWPPSTKDFRLVGGPSADQMPPLWNDSCYIGPEDDIVDAMADILCPADLDVTKTEAGALACGEADPVQVLAIYRLKTDQTWDTWFPEDPEGAQEPALSSMTKLAPYNQLFILMSDNVWWTQEVTSGPGADKVDLVEKWNSVCYAGASKAPADATAGIANDFQILYTFGLDQRWLRYVPGLPMLNTLVNLDQYTSVLLLVTTSAGTTWVFDP